MSGRGITFKGGGNGDPAKYTMKAKLSDGTWLELEVLFIAVGDHKAEDVFKGLELTGAYLNEADLLPQDVLEYLTLRVGRYPSAVEGGPSWSGIWMDFNAIDVEHYLYDILFDEPAENIDTFRQPSGRSEFAENVENIPVDYYTTRVAHQPKWWINKNVHSKFGASRDGKPVYDEFNDIIHTASHELDPIKGLKILLAFDAGRTPACTFSQTTVEGQFRIFDSVTREAIGATAFAEQIKAYIVQVYGFENWEFEGVGDPAADKPGDQSDEDWLTIVGNVLGIKIKPANTNMPSKRQEAVRIKLNKNIGGGEPGLLLCPVKCKLLRKGFNQGYKFKKVLGSGGLFSDEPLKNEYSHVHDALQYGALHTTSNSELSGKTPKNSSAKKAPAPKRRNSMSVRRRRTG